jgi:cysteine desulfurase/selenocysteine lyase
MTTADRDAVAVDGVELPGAAALPDVASLARMANEFFKALPGDPVTAAPATPTPTRVEGPSKGQDSPPSFAPALPLVPSVPFPERGPAALASGPSLYFLDEARSLARPASGLPSEAPRVESHSFLPDLVPTLELATRQFDVASVRRDFPILNEVVDGHSLIWLDNAATTQKPWSVIDRIAHFYEHENSNIHRGAHTLAARSTDAYEAARDKVRRFLGAGSTNEIVFVRGATEAINLVAQAWGRRYVGRDDEIVITWLEHHSNIVPWQMLASEKGARLRVAPVDDDGQILLDEYEKLLGPRTRIVSLTHVSNALGTVTPVREMIEMAHRHGARVLVDGAQAVSHLRVDVRALDADFYALSGHKVFGPTGIGVLYGKEDLLNATPPWQGGGNMIKDVTFEKTSYHPAPMRFEAGTGNIADAVGLGAALDYLEQIGIENVTRHEHDLLTYGTEALQSVPGLRLIGTAREKAGVLSFMLDGFRAEEVGAALASEGIAVRAGHHCAQPAVRRFGLESTVRPSLALYNCREDLDALVSVLRRIRGGRRVR